MPQSYIALILAIVAEVIGTSALQASQQFSKLVPSIIVVVAYGVSFYMLALVLRSVPVGVAYAVWSGLGIVLITLVGWIVFGQKLDLAAFIGLSLIIAGVAILHLFSGSTGH